jgi:hypothetical protein
MRRRTSFNPKRSLLPVSPEAATVERLRRLACTAKYGGNPEHKRDPGDFGLTPPSLPRMGKTLCDSVGVFSRAEALRWLREGLKRGVVSRQDRGGWPQNVWAVTEDGQPLEAQLEGEGRYHG